MSPGSIEEAQYSAFFSFSHGCQSPIITVRHGRLKTFRRHRAGVAAVEMSGG